MDNLHQSNAPAGYKSLDMARLKGCIPIWHQSGVFTNPEKGRTILLGLVGEAQAGAMLGLLKQAGTIHNIYRSLEPYCLIDPLAMYYDSGLLLFTCLYAEIAALGRNWDGAYECCEAVLDHIPGVIERIAKSQPKVPTYNEVRWLALRTLADVKWQADEADRDRLSTPEQIVSQFLEINEMVMPKLQTADYYDEEDNQNTIDSIKLCHFNILKMSFRFLPIETTVGLIMRYNKQCDEPVLALREGAWRGSETETKPLRYFDFEIAKSFMEDKLSIQDLDYLHGLRNDTRNSTNESAPLYLQALKLEYNWMAKHCFRRLEVMGA